MEAIWARGRDNARTPMQWDDTENAGFTKGTPWLPVNDNYRSIHAKAALEDPNSVFHCYRKLIRLRKEYPIFREGAFTLLDRENPWVFAYTRDTEKEHLLVVCNFTAEEREFTVPGQFGSGEKLLGNYPGTVSALRPYEAAIYYYEERK